MYTSCFLKSTHTPNIYTYRQTLSLPEAFPILPEGRVEYNPGDLPIGIKPEEIPANGLTIGETNRTIDTNRSWAVLKNIETMPDYRALLMALLGELEPVVAPRTGAMLTPQGFVFISSPGSFTPFHFDPQHNILLQLRGHNSMNIWPAGNERFAPRPAPDRPSH